MGTEQEKGIIELSVFREFILKSGLPINPASIEKRSGCSEPDIFSELYDEGAVAFELVEICAQDLAEKISFAQAGGTFHVSSVENPTIKLIRNKFSKAYRTDLPLELLCYTSARVIDTDDMILCDIRSVANNSQGQFRRIWLLGETGDVYEVWKLF